MRLGTWIATATALALLVMGARWLRRGRRETGDHVDGPSRPDADASGTSSRVHPFDQEPEA